MKYILNSRKNSLASTRTHCERMTSKVCSFTVINYCILLIHLNKTATLQVALFCSLSLGCLELCLAFLLIYLYSQQYSPLIV